MHLFFARFNNSEALSEEVSRLVQLNPAAVSYIPEALQYFTTSESIINDSADVSFKSILWFFISFNTFYLKFGYCGVLLIHILNIVETL